jgi:hypothetical protein
VEEPAAEAAPGARFATVWDQSTFRNAQFPTALSARAIKTGFGAAHVTVFGGAALPARGRHAWTVVFAGAAGGDLSGSAFAGVAERKKTANTGISKKRGAYGLRDDKDKDALRIDGKGKGAVRRNTHGRAFSLGDSVTCVADMDARPRSLALYRNAEPEPLGTVAGFGAEVYVCAEYEPVPFMELDELVLSFGGGPAEAARTAAAERAAGTAASFAQAERSDGLRVSGFPDGEYPTLHGIFTRDMAAPTANGRPHWSTAEGGHLYYSVTSKWSLNPYGFTPDKPNCNSAFATAGAVPVGEAVWEYHDGSVWGERTLTVAEL